MRALGENYFRSNLFANALFRNTLFFFLIRRERCLMLCFQIFFFGVAFADEIFANDILAENFYKLKLRPDQNELLLK